MRHSIVATLTLALAGCVALRPGTDHQTPIATEIVARPTVAVVVRGSSIEREMTVSQMDKEFADWVASVERAFNDSGLFEEVSIGLHPATRRARVDIVREQDVDQTAFTLSGLTWGLLPLT